MQKTVRKAWRILVVLLMLGGGFLAGQASATLSVTPITWNVVGLDSNSPATGPQNFPVGVRICTNVATTGVTSAFVWDTVNTFITNRVGSQTSLSLGNLAANACVDAYYEVSVTQTASAFDTTRGFHITATDATGTYSSPVPREIYVEHLISQNRNGIDDVLLDGVSIPAGGSMNLVVGNTYAITLKGHTATQGYEQFEAFINFPNTIFQVLSVATTYSAGVPSSTLLYADACTWDNNPSSPTYRACLASGKTGGTVTTVYTVKIISGGGTSQTLNTLLYDFSGSSYHYNADYSAGARIGVITDPTSANLTKAFAPSTTIVGGVSTLTFTLTNPTGVLVTGYNFTDVLPTNVQVAATPGVTSSGCGSPTFAPAAGATTLSFTNGSIAANSSCTVSVKVTPTGTGTFLNTSGHLFIGATDTGKFGTATLTVITTPPTTCNVGRLAQWTFENIATGTNTTTPAFSSKAGNVATATALFVNGTNINGADSATIVSTNGPSAAGSVSWSTGDNWTSTNTAPNVDNGSYTGPYFNFTLDTSNYSGGTVTMTFDIDPEGNADWASASNPVWLYVSKDSGAFGTPVTISPTAATKGTWSGNTFTMTALVPGTSSTVFRIVLGGASSNKNPVARIDNVTFTGTCSVLQKPTLTKVFAPNPTAVNAVSVLTFTLTNPNSTTALTGVTFTDALPAGVQVAATPGASTTCGNTPTWAPAAAATSLTFGAPTSATIPAGSSCTAQVNVIATTAGPHDNVSGYISSTQTGTNFSPTGSATATLTAVSPPSMIKSFSPDPIIQNGVSTLTFTISNPNLSNAISGVAFSDTLPVAPGAMKVAASPGVTTSGCGSPTFAPLANATALTFTGGTIAAGGTCFVTVNVTASVLGTYTNTSGTVSHIINAATVNGNTASDTLTVTVAHPALQLLKQVSTSATGPWTSLISVPQPTNIFYRFTVENTGDVPLTLNTSGFLSDPTLAAQVAACVWKNGSNVTLTFPAVIPVASNLNNDHIITCVVGPVGSTAGINTNTATATGTFPGTTSCGAPCTDTSSATYETGQITLAKAAVQSSFPQAGAIVDYNYVVTNVGPAIAGPTVTVTDNKVTVTCPSIFSVYGTTYLQAGQTLTCDASYTTTAADVTAGSVTNTATAFVGGLTSNQSSATVPYIAGVTRAVLSRMSAYIEAGQSFVEWETTSEIGTAGFNVYRQGPGGWTKINTRLLPALVGRQQGGVYRIADPGRSLGAQVMYRLEEVEATGGKRKFAPAALFVGSGRPAPVAPVAKAPDATVTSATSYQRTAHAPNGRSAKFSATAGAIVTTGSTLRILVEQDGLYVITADQIATTFSGNLSQAKQWIAKTQLRLQQKGQQVAWMADPAGDKLYFYGQALTGTDSVYAKFNVYLLDRAAGVAMSVVSGAAPAPAGALQPFVSTVHAEKNVLGLPFVTNDPDADFWYWDYLQADIPGLGAGKSFAVSAPNASASGTATITARLQGSTDLSPGNDHHAHILVNGTEVGSGSWDGINPQAVTASFPASLLAADGNNVVTVVPELDAGIDLSVFLVDSFDLTYPRAYQASADQLRLRGAGNPVVTVGGFSGGAIGVLDISTPRTPKWIAAKTAAANGVSFAPANAANDYLTAIAKAPYSVTADTPSTALKAKTNAATYVVLSPAELATGAAALASYRGGKVVSLKAIYDEFSFGITNPYAVRDFLAYATQNWATKPKQAALVGKGTFDPKDYSGYGTNLFPVLMGATPDGLSGADNRFADFNNDGVPDIAIGRIPALSSDDVSNYVTKLAGYDAASRRPARQALLVADVPDDGGSFTTDNIAVAQALQQRGYTTTAIELQYTALAVAQSQMFDALNSPAGAGIFNFIGHGGTNQIGNQPLLLNDPGFENVSSLTNGAKLPLFLAFTCAVGDGTYPGFDSLAESLLWQPGGGAIASFAATALTLNGQSHALNMSLINTLVGPNARPSFGEAATAALKDFATQGGPRFMLETYSIVGDPALRVQQ